MSGPPTPASADPAADFWPDAEGQAIDCREKLRMLHANHAEVTGALRDAFEDAVLMGVDAKAMRRLLHTVVDELQDPRPGRESGAETRR